MNWRPLPSRGTWAAMTAPVDLPDPLAVSERLGTPALVWEKPSTGDALVGFGVLASVEATQPGMIATLVDGLAAPGQFQWLQADSLPRPPGPWFGGIAFDPQRAAKESWEGFPPSRWILPELLVWIRGRQAYLTGFHPATGANGDARSSLEQQLADVRERLRLTKIRNDASTPPLEIQSDRTQWAGLMERALTCIANGSLEKVVLARSIDVRSSEPFNAVRVIDSLREAAPNCTTFLVRGTADSVFVGATPEMLCRWFDSVLQTEALAGSAPLSDASALLQSDKENREHMAVIEGITQALGPLSDRVSVDESPTLFGLRHLFHLRTAIQAHLRPGATTSQVLRALHPTPAVGGTPRDRALRFLAEHEGLERGWYGGAVGWIGEEGVDLAVAIRSALIRDRWARLFVGAGVVAGSTAEGEWQETQTKALTMLAALGGSNAPG